MADPGRDPLADDDRHEDRDQDQRDLRPGQNVERALELQAYATGVYNEQVHYPLALAETIADLQAYRWPSPDWYDYAALPGLAAHYPGRAIECGYTAIFYWHNRLRGLEQSLMDPLLRPDFTHYLIERVSEFFTEYHRRCFEPRSYVSLWQTCPDCWQNNASLSTVRI